MSPSSAFVTIFAQALPHPPRPPVHTSPGAGTYTVMHPSELVRGKWHGRGAQGPPRWCLGTPMPRHALGTGEGHPPYQFGVGQEASWPHAPLQAATSDGSSIPARAPRHSVGGGGSPRLPGPAARSCRGSSALPCHAVPAHGHRQSLPAPALSRSKATAQPCGGEGWGGGGAGGTVAEETAGARPAGHGDTDGAAGEPRLRPPSDGAGKMTAGTRRVQLTQGKPLLRTSKEKEEKNPDKHTETPAKPSVSPAHWVSPGRREMKPPCKPTSGHLIRKTVPKGVP